MQAETEQRSSQQPPQQRSRNRARLPALRLRMLPTSPLAAWSLEQASCPVQCLRDGGAHLGDVLVKAHPCTEFLKSACRWQEEGWAGQEEAGAEQGGAAGGGAGQGRGARSNRGHAPGPGALLTSLSVATASAHIRNQGAAQDCRTPVWLMSQTKRPRVCCPTACCSAERTTMPVWVGRWRLSRTHGKQQWRARVASACWTTPSCCPGEHG